ncbi:pentapeptide repeat-containing protein, partial [Paenibacillus sp. NPDC056722]|uniref:pentapeptide repeat-containing protein n=1 Tax=Paenibacillus sp. NPDC056722 TaxID=3345924 RepID=UPI0036952685
MRQVRRWVGRLFGWAGWPTVVALATASAAISAIWFSGQSLQATQDQYKLSEQGQVTDRFTKATEQLGSDKLDVRLGGIYALERLARDSPVDHPTVVEVLSALVRTHTPAPTTCSRPSGTSPDLPADIHAAITVIGRRDITLDRNLADLSKSCLHSVNLTGEKLIHTDLSDANLSNANLHDADLTGALLFRTKLVGANLTYVNLTSASLTDVDLTDARLDSAKLAGAFLLGGNLGGASLFEANLAGADLSYANLTGAKLNVADLTRADLTSTNLTGANLAYTNLTGANLTDANLTGATLDEILYSGNTLW